MIRTAENGEEFVVRSNAGTWLVAWHPPMRPPEGKAHGANAFCVTGSGEVVLISDDERRWGWPGGRPEGSESWEETMVREVFEEACATVRRSRLLGFSRAVCDAGPEKGLILVRSIWRAEVDLLPWRPCFEISYRRAVPADELLAHLWMEDGLEPFYGRALVEAGLA